MSAYRNRGRRKAPLSIAADSILRLGRGFDHQFALTQAGAALIKAARTQHARRDLLESMMHGEADGMVCKRCGMSIKDAILVMSAAPYGHLCLANKEVIEGLTACGGKGEVFIDDVATLPSVWDRSSVQHAFEAQIMAAISAASGEVPVIGGVLSETAF